jgi:hypothetical protein
VRCFVLGDVLHIEHEAYQLKADLDRIGDVFDRVPGSRRWPIYADASQPGTIALAAKRGYHIKGADKWPGSVEDGVAALRGFARIVIHPRCPHAADEARLWSRKIDKLTQEPLPDLKPGHDHVFDAVRYALTGAGLITKTGSHLHLYQGIGQTAASDAPAETIDDARAGHLPLRAAPEAPAAESIAQRVIAQAAREGVALRLMGGQLQVIAPFEHGCPRALSLALQTAVANHGPEVAGWLQAQAPVEPELEPDEELIE